MGTETAWLSDAVEAGDKQPIVNIIHNLSELAVLSKRLSKLSSISDEEFFKYRKFDILELISFDIIPLIHGLSTVEDETVRETILDFIQAIILFQNSLKTSSKEKFSEVLKELIRELKTLVVYAVHINQITGLGIEEDSFKEGSVEEDSVEEDSVEEDSFKEDSIKSIKEDSFKKDSIAEERARKAPFVYVSKEPDWLDKSWVWVKKHKYQLGIGALVGMGLAVGTVLTFGALGVIAGGTAAGFGFTAVATGLTVGTTTSVGAGVGFSLGIGALGGALIGVVGHKIVNTVCSLKKLFSSRKKADSANEKKGDSVNAKKADSNNRRKVTWAQNIIEAEISPQASALPLPRSSTGFMFSSEIGRPGSGSESDDMLEVPKGRLSYSNPRAINTRTKSLDSPPSSPPLPLSLSPSL